jgi:hypothetical protein
MGHMWYLLFWRLPSAARCASAGRQCRQIHVDGMYEITCAVLVSRSVAVAQRAAVLAAPLQDGRHI